MVDWVAEVEVNQTGTRADHSAVRLHLRSPDDPVRVRKPAKVYPPPQIATEAVKEAIQRRLANFLTELKTDTPDAAIWACKWDTLKVDIRKETLTIIKTRRKTARATYKQKIRRLLKQELRLRDAVEGHSPSIDSVTNALDVLTLNEGHGGSPLQRVRHAIAECTRMRAVAHQRRLFREGGHGEGKTTKAMFRRVSTKYADNEIHCLDAAIDHQARGVHEKADTLADAWSPIFQQPGSSKKARAEVLSWLGTKRQYETDLADLIESFTEAEVAAAIGASKPGKACGPDRLGNDWYRDFAEQLIPILTIMMNCWYSAGVFPPSFLEADIFCLKKGGAMQNPLNYRPLALLDTDYKILTRMLATRTSRKLHAIIHRNQNGFVPFRTIHETIDLYAAAQAAAQSDPAMRTALALLLDFCKAYDSVDRELLYDVLEWLGCPKDYGQAMRKLHDGTKVHFLANGFRSRWVRVTCGIRQGCPLAPLLFLFVLEALYRRIDAETSVKGIMLRSGAGSVQLKVGGYADDTASYVRSTAEIPPIMSITQVFATASGLRLNAEKTLVIALNPNAISTMDQLPAPLVVQPAAKLSRYLGIPVGSIPDDDYTWTLTTTLLVTRLALAARKTMTADQRSMVVAAVVIPKLTFIARHIWPTSDWIARFQKMINNFVWHARFTDGHVAGRAWLNGHVEALPRKHGGLNIPALKLELLSLAAVTVSKWALEAELDTLIVGDVLAGNRSSPQAPPLYVSPRHTIPSTNGKRMCATLWATGVLVSSTFGGETALPEKSSMVRALHCSTYFRGPLGLFWRGRRLHVDTSPLSGPLSRSYMAAEADVHGTFCTEWLPFVVLSELRLYSERGVVVNPNTRFRAICHRGRLLKDVLHWTWKRNGGMLVTALCKHFNSAVRGQVVYLFQLLLLNYPQLLVPGDHSGDIRYTTLPEEHVPIKRQISNERHLMGGARSSPRKDPQVCDNHVGFTPTPGCPD
ncbi:hypothetical protein PR003_g27539 [Phytophthora rubi]|uniref:Reverse transcriptase domain-containing protein n=1 Tax=Phytophthora rubi TaxID=129364 RepID=A0A6A4C5Z5_9STRA|nr:hypothetical protein PR003_g27539 [Phytophthora rubi]